MAEGFQEILKKLNEIKEDIEKKIQNLDLKITNYQEQISGVINKMDNLQANIKTLRNDINVNKKSVAHLMRCNKDKNIILYNITESDSSTLEELENKVIAILQDNLKVHVDLNEIDQITRLGRQTSSNRPILIKFLSLRKKIKILKLAKNLRGTNIIMSQDYPYEVRQTRKKLLPYMYKARNMQFKSFLRYDKLMINEVLYTLEELALLDQDEVLSIGASTASELDLESEKEKEFTTEEEGRKQGTPRSRKKVKKVIEKQQEPMLKWLQKKETNRSSEMLKKRKVEQSFLP